MPSSQTLPSPKIHRISGSLPESLKDDPNQSAEIFAVFRDSDLRLVYLNETGCYRIDRALELEIDSLSLPDLIGVGATQRFQSEILLKTRIFGRWEGICEMRDAWGSAFTSQISLYTRSSPELPGTKLLCLCASPSDTSQIQLGHASLTDREFLHCLLTSLPDHIYFKDRSSRFLLISRAKSLQHNLNDPREAIGKTDFDFFSADHASRAFADEQQILQTGQPLINVEESQTWHDGRRTWASTTKMPLHDSEGNVVGTFGISRDITTAKKLAEDRRELELQLQLNSKLESIGRLAAGIAHEINTPTQYLTTNLRFLDESCAVLSSVFNAHRAFKDAIAASPLASDPAIATALATITQADSDADLPYLLGEIPVTLKQSLEGLDRVARIVRSLKDFSHPGSSNKVPVDLNKIAENAITVSRHEWKYVADVFTDFAPDLRPVPCIADQVGQVILNLVINAAHSIGDTLKPRNRERGLITVRTRTTSTHAIIDVQDDGTGIPDDIRERIFEPFFTTKPVGKGTGQGLALVRTIVETNHRGFISLETKVGSGSIFILRFPYEPTPDAPATGIEIPPGHIAPP